MPGQTTGAGPARPGARQPREWTGVTALLAALAITQLACTNLLAQPAPPIVNAIISGKVYGDRLLDQQAGKSVTVPLVATVRCNASSAQTTADGSYRLTVSQAPQYTCSASALTYLAAQTVLVGSLGPLFHLDFGGPTPVTACSVPALTPTITSATTAALTPTATSSSATIAPTTSAGVRSVLSAVLECPELRLRTGSITGVVTSADDRTPAAGARLACWNPHGSPTEDLTPAGTYQTQTDANGAFSLVDLPIDRYLCTAGSDPTPTVMSPAPGTTTTVSMTMCAKHCPTVAYQGGPVMHTMTAYIVFWLPSGDMYSTVGNAHFESLIQRYFRDVGGTSYYNILTQYWDTLTGFIANKVSLGDVYVDTHPYPHAGTRRDPLTPSDLAQEVTGVVSAHNWTSDTTHAVFMYTAYGAEICDSASGGLCTFPHASQQVFCGYHSRTGDNLIFSVIADSQSCTGGAYAAPYDSPNGDRLADEALITTSHEQFESATDPDTHGWWAGDASTGEIGDKCEQSSQQVTLSGHPYWVQPEWSDRSNSCVYGL